MKNKKINVILTIIGVVIVFTGFYAALYMYIYMSSDKYFIHNKVARSIHMNYTFNNDDLINYIFIGSSKTLFGISTEVMKEEGIFIYNYGVPGLNVSDMPYIVNKAVGKKVNYIVLHLDVSQLYGSSVNPRFPTYFDYSFINSAIGTSFKFKSINELVSSEVRIKDILHNILNRNVGVRHTEENEISKRLISLKVDDDLIDCSIQRFSSKGPDYTTMYCNNGDGLIYGNAKNYSPVTIELKYIDDRLKLFNSYLSYIKKSGITPIVIFNPSFYNRTYSFDISYLKKILNTENVIDNSLYGIKDVSLWADSGHLNLKGRAVYSRKVAKQLIELSK